MCFLLHSLLQDFLLLERRTAAELLIILRSDSYFRAVESERAAPRIPPDGPFFTSGPHAGRLMELAASVWAGLTYSQLPESSPRSHVITPNERWQRQCRIKSAVTSLPPHWTPSSPRYCSRSHFLFVFSSSTNIHLHTHTLPPSQRHGWRKRKVWSVGGNVGWLICSEVAIRVTVVHASQESDSAGIMLIKYIYIYMAFIVYSYLHLLKEIRMVPIRC